MSIKQKHLPPAPKDLNTYDPNILCSILNVTESIGDRIVGYEGCSNLVASSLAISIVDIGHEQFKSLTFGVSSDQAGMKPQVTNPGTPLHPKVLFYRSHVLPLLSSIPPSLVCRSISTGIPATTQWPLSLCHLA